MHKIMVMWFAATVFFSINARGQEQAVSIDNLSFLEGEWVAQQSFFSDGNPVEQPVPNQVNFQKSLNDKLLSGMMKYETGQFAMNFLMSFSYDLYRAQFRVSIIDDSTGLMDMFEGRMDKGGKLIATNIPTDTWFPNSQGDKGFSKLTVESLSETEARIVINSSPDRGVRWHQFLQYDLRRVN